MLIGLFRCAFARCSARQWSSVHRNEVDPATMDEVEGGRSDSRAKGSDFCCHLPPADWMSNRYRSPARAEATTPSQTPVSSICVRDASRPVQSLKPPNTRTARAFGAQTRNRTPSPGSSRCAPKTFHSRAAACSARRHGRLTLSTTTVHQFARVRRARCRCGRRLLQSVDGHSSSNHAPAVSRPSRLRLRSPRLRRAPRRRP